MPRVRSAPSAAGRPAPARPQTRERLIDAAAVVFAERGYRGATMREIADRAGANLAAAHYHIGSKDELYREVLSAHFERLEHRLAESGASPGRAATARLSRDQLIALLRARVRTLLETFFEPTSVHATLMHRELADPSETLAVIVRRWLDPMRREAEQVLQLLAPQLSPAAVAFAARSLVGQVVFYFTHRPALLIMMRRRSYPADFLDATADGVVAFTLGGLEGLAGAAPRQRARPGRRAKP